MKVLVVGGGGFIGSALVKKLLLEGLNTVSISKHKIDGNKEAKNYKVDIRNSDALENIFRKEKPDVVINQAAIVYWGNRTKNPIKDIETTVIGTINLIENCINYKVKKFIFASSISVYGNPVGNKCVREKDVISISDIPEEIFSYALTKYMAEQYIQYYSRIFALDYTILRYAHVYGPREEKDVIAKFIKATINKKPLTIYGDGTQSRDYIYIDDAIEATVKSLALGANKILNIGGGKLTSVNKLIGIFKSIFPDIQVVKTKAIESVSRKVYMDIHLAKKELDWKPDIGLKEGIIKTYKSMVSS